MKAKKMKAKKRIITISTMAGIAVICTAVVGLSGKANDCLNKKIEVVANKQIDKDPRLAVIPKIKKDTEDIKLLIAIMNKNNPNYDEAMKILKSRK